MIRLVKTALNKTIGNGMVRWKELEEVLLDVEVALNNRPLCHLDEDLQLPVLGHVEHVVAGVVVCHGWVGTKGAPVIGASCCGALPA